MKIVLTILTSICAISVAFTQIPTDNLILHLPFNGSAEDMSGNDLDGTVEGAILTTDRYGTTESAYEFDGVDDYINILADPLMNVEFPFTLSLWYYRTEPADMVQSFFKSDANSEIYSGFWISMLPTGEIGAGYGNGIGLGFEHRITRLSNASPELDEWHHVLAVFNNLEDIDLYIDCELAPATYTGSGTSMGYFGVSSTIGKYDTRLFTGKLDDIRVYSDAITEEEVPHFCNDSTTQTNSIGEAVKDSPIVSIYPNPASNILNLTFGTPNELIETYNYSILDLYGKTIYTSIIENQNEQIDLNNLGLAHGMYLLQIHNQSAELIQTTKFVYD